MAAGARGASSSVDQVFVTTHSNHILDAVGEDIRLVRISQGEDRRSIVQPIGSQVLEALRDLGVRPSSLDEANAVLWVEGPSDAIYLRHWLSRWGPKFIEGVDFVFAFHAGTLLHHSTEKRSVESVSVIGEINPNYFLVLDKDPNEHGEPGHAYAQPWIKHGCSWITEPKEIEGYLSDAALLDAFKKPTSSKASDTATSLLARLTSLGLAGSWSKRKVDLARKVVEMAKAGVDVDHAQHRDHLKRNVDRIIEFFNECRADDPSRDVS
jgi:hypothetical protein